MTPSTGLLVLAHSRGGTTARLADAVVAGARYAFDEIVDLPPDGRTGRPAAPDQPAVVRLDVTEAGLADVVAAGAVVFVTPARFGALAGLTKDLLERIYPWFEEAPDLRPGLPWTAVAKGATDPSGAVRDLERILTGLRWKQVLTPLQVVGDVTEAHLASAHEVGATMAAGLATGLW